MLVVAGVGGIAGCNNDPLKKVHVSGVVTFDGQSCPDSGRVVFSPVEIPEGLPRRPAFGSFKQDGAYEATSFRPGDGLVPGKYLVGVTCYDNSMLPGAPSDADIARASYVAGDFEPIDFVVEPGSGSAELNIDVPLRRPK